LHLILYGGGQEEKLFVFCIELSEHTTSYWKVTHIIKFWSVLAQ